MRSAYLEHAGTNIPPEHALDLLDQAANALDFLAGIKLKGFSSVRGLQHCDIKPSNLLLIGNKLKVADFGLCSGSGWHTHSGGWKGTRLPYVSPPRELYNGSATAGTDQYALAVTFCEMVMGDRAFFKGGSWPGIPSTPIDLTKLRDREYPVIAKALHPYPSSRWPTCQAFIQALRKAVRADPNRRFGAHLPARHPRLVAAKRAEKNHRVQGGEMTGTASVPVARFRATQARCALGREKNPPRWRFGLVVSPQLGASGL